MLQCARDVIRGAINCACAAFDQQQDGGRNEQGNALGIYIEQ